MNKTLLHFILCLLTCIGTLPAQTVLPFFSMKEDFGGEAVNNPTDFVPNSGEYTLEVQGNPGTEIHIAFSRIRYTPSSPDTVRFAQKEGKVYIFENGVFKTVFTPETHYTTSGNNLIRNAGFEEVSEEFSAGRWKPTVWDTWNLGTSTWGGESGQTNVREDANYCSEGKKSIIMHSATRQLMQPLPDEAFIPGAHYLLTYDYWTSAGWGNGGATYEIYLKKIRPATNS